MITELGLVVIQRALRDGFRSASELDKLTGDV
jgi:hypothetical protein